MFLGPSLHADYCDGDLLAPPPPPFISRHVSLPPPFTFGHTPRRSPRFAGILLLPGFTSTVILFPSFYLLYNFFSPLTTRIFPSSDQFPVAVNIFYFYSSNLLFSDPIRHCFNIFGPFPHTPPSHKSPLFPPPARQKDNEKGCDR